MRTAAEQFSVQGHGEISPLIEGIILHGFALLAVACVLLCILALVNPFHSCCTSESCQLHVQQEEDQQETLLSMME